MVQHFISVAAALTLTVWATVLNQYHQFQVPGAPTPSVTLEIPFATSTEPVVTQSIAPPQLEIVLPTPSLPTTAEPKPAPTTAQPSVPFTPLPVPVTPVVTTPTVPTTPVAPVVTPVEQTLTAEALLKGSIVNIICLPGGGLRGSSGTGIIIDPRGIILTVAHVGQQFLLVDYPTAGAGNCYIRTGSPAKNAYTANLVYISREWLADNPTVFLDSRPRGTGENDYALLAISGSLTSSSLPRSFTYIPLASPNTSVEIGDRVGVGSYAAEFLTSSEVRSSLYPTISFAPVDDVYTFSQRTKDVISVLAGAAAQEGSSGGAVINADNELVGLISTRTVKSDLSLRELQAISVDHIRRSFSEDMGENLDNYLSNNTLVTLVSAFRAPASELLENLTTAIEAFRN